MSTLAERIKDLRQEADLTQEEFGKLFGIVKSTVSLYESGKSTPDDELKKKMAEYFNVSLDYLMGISDIRNPYINKEDDSVTKEKYPDALEFIDDFVKEMEKHGYDFSNKSKEEIAEIIVKALKIAEITKSN